MQPDLPWNIAGIPPEAREAARAAARREGLSVGEWLTRRILRALMEGHSAAENGRETWRAAAPACEQPRANGARDSDDMLARVSRSESESQNANRRIEEQLRAVARRLDQTERSQTENNRAMSKAAAEISVAAHEQAQALDQLSAHVVGLNERLSRIERDAPSAGMKEAVRALHQGLSRLADQMSQTANQSASQIETLAGNVEQVAGKLVEARQGVDHVSQTLNDRITTIDMRVRKAEHDAQTHAEAFAKGLGALQDFSDAHKALEDDLQAHASGLAKLNETLDRLTARFADSNVQHSGTVARLSEDVARLETPQTDTVSEHSLQSIEHALNDIATRLEKTEHHNLGAAGTVEEDPGALASQVDTADQYDLETVAALRADAQETTERLQDVDLQPQTASPSAPPLQPAEQPAAPVFDVPSMPDHASLAPQPALEETVAPLAAAAADAPPVATESNSGGHAFGADAFAAHAPQEAGAAGAASFLAAARRSARTAADAGAERGSGPFGGFAWSAPRGADEPEARSNIIRYGLVAALGVLIIAAVVAGAVLSRNFLNPPAQLSMPAKPPARLALKGTASTEPQAPVANKTTSVTMPPTSVTKPTVAAATPPGSPVVPLTHVAKMPASAQLTPPVAAHQATAQPTVAATPNVPPTAQKKVPSPLDRLSSLANGGNANAELLLGLRYLDGEGVAVNEAEAAKWLERAAKQNVAVAAYRLGTLYERGHGVPADPARAAQWYDAAAKAGNRKAMHKLAVAYADGAGVKKDLVVAAQWFTRAANLGLVDSQFNLAVLYERGMGVPQSLIDAYKWYAVAAQQGDAESKSRIEAISTQLSAEDKTAAQKAAESFRADAPARAANSPPDISTVLGG